MASFSSSSSLGTHYLVQPGLKLMVIPWPHSPLMLIRAMRHYVWLLKVSLEGVA